MRLPLFFISLSAIYLQISLIRYMANIFYGNMTYFIVSVALLGFGASGTWLTLRLKKTGRGKTDFIKISSLSLISCSMALLIKARIPLNLIYILYDVRQIFYLLLYSFLFFVPFFLFGLFIGSQLIDSENKGIDYGINLLGSAAGGLLSLALMYIIDPVMLPRLTIIPLGLSTAILMAKQGKSNSLPLVLSSFFSISLFILLPSTPESDQYKDIVQFRILEEQDQARREAMDLSPYGKLEIWFSPLSHYTLFAGLHNPHSPPEQLTILNDGDIIGSVFMIDNYDEAEILSYTIQSLPYRLYENADILIVGDSGLQNLWLALSHSPRSVTVFLTHKSLEKMLRGELSQWTEHATDPRVNIISGDFRKHLIGSHASYDLIHFASAESLKGSLSGLNSYREDYILTSDSFSQSLSSLKPGGVISLSRGKHLPPRDNIKIAKSLEKAGGNSKPIQFENYLAVISLLFKTPLKEDKLSRLNDAARSLNLTPFNRAFEEAEEVFDLRPPDDNRPYFHSFFRLSSLREFRQYFGSHWFREAHAGYLILLITFLFLLIAAFIFILMPHLFNKRPLKVPFLLYFPSIGFAFMFVEMVLIQKMALFLEHSSLSISLVLSAILFFSGLGSLYMENATIDKKTKLLKLAWTAISILTLSTVIFSDALFYASARLSALGIPLLWFFIFAYSGTCAFFMGWFFAPGLSLLESNHKESLPVAWALNGFASVAASPLAVLLSISYGFSVPLALAMFLYLSAALLFAYQSRSDSQQ